MSAFAVSLGAGKRVLVHTTAIEFSNATVTPTLALTAYAHGSATAFSGVSFTMSPTDPAAFYINNSTPPTTGTLIDIKVSATGTSGPEKTDVMTVTLLPDGHAMKTLTITAVDPQEDIP